MSDTILVALITGGLALMGTVVSVMMGNRLTNYRIEQIEVKFDKLETKVEKHNNLVERLAAVEQSARSAHHRLNDIKDDLK